MADARSWPFVPRVCVSRFPRASEQPNYANEYSLGAFGYGSAQQQPLPSQHLQQQQQPPSQHLQQQAAKAKFDYAQQAQEQQQQQAPPQQFQQAPAYSYNYGYGQYAAYQQQQQQQAVAMNHVNLATQQQQQHAVHHSYGGGDPLGMLVSSATQPDAMQQQQPQDMSKSVGSGNGVKYRGAFAVPASQDSFMSSSGASAQPMQAYGEQLRPQDSFLKYTSQQQQQQPQHLGMDHAPFRSHNAMPSASAYTSGGGGASGSAGAVPTGSYPSYQATHRVQTSMDLVSPTSAAVAMSSSYSSLQRMTNGYSLSTNGGGGASASTSNSGNVSGSASRMPNLFPGSGAALTHLSSRSKDESDLYDPRIAPPSLSFDPPQQQQQQHVASTGGSVKAMSASMYADASSANTMLSEAPSGNSQNTSSSSSGGGMYRSTAAHLTALQPQTQQQQQQVHTGAVDTSGHPGGASLASAAANEVCSLCLGTECDCIATACGHRFHSSCLQDWGEKLACPMCRPVRRPSCELVDSYLRALADLLALFVHRNALGDAPDHEPRPGQQRQCGGGDSVPRELCGWHERQHGRAPRCADAPASDECVAPVAAAATAAAVDAAARCAVQASARTKRCESSALDGGGCVCWSSECSATADRYALDGRWRQELSVVDWRNADALELDDVEQWLWPCAQEQEAQGLLGARLRPYGAVARTVQRPRRWSALRLCGLRLERPRRRVLH